MITSKRSAILTLDCHKFLTKAPSATKSWRRALQIVEKLIDLSSQRQGKFTLVVRQQAGWKGSHKLPFKINKYDSSRGVVLTISPPGCGTDAVYDYYLVHSTMRPASLFEELKRAEALWLAELQMEKNMQVARTQPTVAGAGVAETSAALTTLLDTPETVAAPEASAEQPLGDGLVAKIQRLQRLAARARERQDLKTKLQTVIATAQAGIEERQRLIRQTEDKLLEVEEADEQDTECKEATQALKALEGLLK